MQYSHTQPISSLPGDINYGRASRNYDLEYQVNSVSGNYNSITHKNIIERPPAFK